MTDMDPNKLLNIAMGVEPMIDLTEEQQIEAAKSHWLSLPKDRKEKILHRRKLREAMFKILKYDVRDMSDKMTTELFALKSLIDNQLDSNLGMKWEGFTFIWDIHPHGTPVVVRKEAWVREGGGFDQELGTHFPSAFTEQEIS
jgi:hypothetical protein